MIRTKSQTVQLALHKNSRRLEATVTWRYCRVQIFSEGNQEIASL